MTDFSLTSDPRNKKVRTQYVVGIHKTKAEVANQIGVNSCPKCGGELHTISKIGKNCFQLRILYAEMAQKLHAKRMKLYMKYEKIFDDNKYLNFLTPVVQIKLDRRGTHSVPSGKTKELIGIVEVGGVIYNE